MSRLKNYFAEITDLGLTGTAYRIYFETALRSGWFARQDSIAKLPKPDTDISDFNLFLSELFPKSQLVEISDFLMRLPSENQEQIIKTADSALQGKIRAFSKILPDYGNPPNWHLNPIKSVKWPVHKHWSIAARFNSGGDIKMVWEASRFPHFFFFVRAFLISGNIKYYNGFVEQVQSWDQNNRYPFGVNWASGQEAAIRMITWIFTYSVFLNFFQPNEEFAERFRQLLLMHSDHIYRHINYARYAVHNNHLIGEALALYIAGNIFKRLPHAQKWYKKGKQILSGKALQQFYGDGGYCQLSHTYHRLALHYYLWAVKIAKKGMDSLPDRVYDILFNSANYLLQNMNSDGRLPNWGNNDGALLNPWTTCDYNDFRPVISAVFRTVGKPAPFPAGEWDEESLWFGLSKKTDPAGFSQISVSFKNSGLHILRQDPANFCVFRCGTAPDRFGQADQLHVDLFWDGQNIACDGGSYLYNDELRYHRYFMGTASHNTVNIDQQDQMLLWRRFKWLYKTKAELTEFDTANRQVSGQHFGYQRLDPGLVHSRRVIYPQDRLIVLDEVRNEKKMSHSFRLHWLLISEITDIESETDTYYEIKSGKYWLYLSKTDSDHIEIKKGFDRDNIISGWTSRYYGFKQAAASVNLVLNSNKNVCFISVFSKQRLNEKEFQKCASS